MRGCPASTDTELLTALLADEPAADTVDALVRVLPRVKGAYSLVILDERRVIGVRDPHGFRPLVLGRLPRTPTVGGPTDGLWDGDEAVGRLVPLVRDGRPRHRGRRVRPRRGARRDRHPRTRAGAALGALCRGDAGPVRVRAHLLRATRFVHGRPQPVRGAPPDGDAAGARAPGRGRPGHAGPRYRALRPRPASPRRRACRTARGCTATGTRAGPSSSRRRACATGA